MSVIFRRHGQGKATPVIITSTSETFYCTRHFCRRPSAFTSRKAFHDHTTILSSSTFTFATSLPIHVPGWKRHCNVGVFAKGLDNFSEQVISMMKKYCAADCAALTTILCTFGEAGWSSASAVAAALPLHLTRCRTRGSMAASKGCISRCLC